MTLEEVCDKYEVAQSSMTNAFPRTQKALLKKYGVKIVKEGRGKNAVYYETIEDNRAVSIYRENKDIISVNQQTMKLLDWDFIVFLAIVITPMYVFRGSFEDFLKYMEVNVTNYNIAALKGALSNLEEQKLISYNLDRTNMSYFVAALNRKTEEDMQIGIDMMRTCRQLADNHKKKSWIPLLKTWLSINILAERQPFTMRDIERMTGLSAYQIKQSTAILRESKIFISSKAYSSSIKCLGTNVDLNVEAFYDLGKNKQIN